MTLAQARLEAAKRAPSADPYEDLARLQALTPSLSAVLRPQAAYRWLLPYLSSITPQYVESVLRGALAGNHVQAWELFDLMPDTDPDIAACLGEYNDGIAAKRLICTPYADEEEEPSPQAQEKNKLISYALRNMRPDPANDENDVVGTVRDIVAARFHGQSVLEVDWMDGYGSNNLNFVDVPGIGRSLVPRSTYWVHPVCYAFNMSGRLGLRTQLVNPDGSPADALVRQGTEYAKQRKAGQVPGSMVEPPAWNMIASQPRPDMLSPFPPDKFLIGIMKAKTGTALGGSCLRALAWWWCARNFCFDFLLNLAQLFGIPFRKATFKHGTAEGVKAEVRGLLQQVGNTGWALLPDSVNLEFESAAGSSGTSPQETFAHLATDMVRKVILRQTMTGGSTAGSSKGVGKSFGEVETDVKAQCIQAGANYACSVINLQLVPSILKQNYGEGGDLEAPVVSLVDDDQGDLLDAQRDQILCQFIDVPASHLRRKYCIPKMSEDDEVAGVDTGTAGAQVKAAKEQQDRQAQMAQDQADAQRAQAEAMAQQNQQPEEEEDQEQGEDILDKNKVIKVPEERLAQMKGHGFRQRAVESRSAVVKPDHVQAAADALRETVKPVLDRLEAIQKVEDLETRKALLQKFVKDHADTSAALLHDTGLAKVLERAVVPAFTKGLKGSSDA